MAFYNIICRSGFGIRLTHVPNRFVKRSLSSLKKKCSFGLLLDIDGVLMRGTDVLPGVREAFAMITDKFGNFRVPTIFVTNAGSSLRATKASQLSEKLRVNVSADLVLLSHSPLRMFKDFHNKHVLVSGQGPIKEISEALGFSHTTSVEELRGIFPYLDCIDHKRRLELMDAGSLVPKENNFPRIEAVVLFGEPVRWETGLQLIIDTLMTGGLPGSTVIQRGSKPPYPHIPILACNMDLLWVAEAPLPRFGHGTFMMCLETLYKKLTGYDLRYTALMGKPSELTYHHAEFCVKEEALRLGLDPPRRLYAIGDNPESDILGANLFNHFLAQRREQLSTAVEAEQVQHQRAVGQRVYPATTWDHIDWDDETMQDHGADHCYSVLVKTGVYSAKCKMNEGPNLGLWDTSRHLGQMVDRNKLREPAFVESNIRSAIEMICDREEFL